MKLTTVMFRRPETLTRALFRPYAFRGGAKAALLCSHHDYGDRDNLRAFNEDNRFPDNI